MSTKPNTKSPVRRSMPNCVYQLRIELQHIAPAIRRRLLISETLTRGKLDRVIQAAMGWNNTHPRDWRAATVEQFIKEVDSHIRWYNEKRIKISLGSLSPIESRESLGLVT